MLVYPVSANFLLSNGPLQRPGSQGVGGRSALTIDPWSVIFGEKASKNGVPFLGLTIVWRTWARFGAENGPTTHFHRFGNVFGRIWKGLGSFWMDFS